MISKTRLILLTLSLVLPLTCGTRSPAEDAAVDDEGRVVNFQRDIVPILRNHCLECHNAEDAKNDFRVDDVSFLDYVEPEDADSSTVYADYLITEDEDMLMPPPSHGGPLSPAELALIRVWINEGADWPEDAEVATSAEQADQSADTEPESAEAPTGFLGRLWAFQGYLHPATVHFPIALLLIGGLFVVLGWKWPNLSSQIALSCLILGAASAIVATMMGWSFAVQEGYGSWAKVDTDSEIFWHRWSAVIVTTIASVFAIIAIYSVRKKKPELDKVWKAGLLVVAALIGAVGHQGGELTYGEDFYPKAFRVLFGEPDPTAKEAVAIETDADETDTTE